MLFYWWPVWAIGYLMALLTLIDGRVVVFVPPDAKVSRTLNVEVEAGKFETREGVYLPRNDKNPSHLLPDTPDVAGNPLPDPTPPRLHMANRSSYGVFFLTVLLLVIVITSVPLRGMWSVVVIMGIVMFSVIFALMGWWDAIFHAIHLLDIRINMGGYIFLSTALLAIWVVTMMFFDKQTYMIFTPGQLRVCLEIGGGETAYDTTGMVIQKQRDDLFRHWILGLGSGDLIVRTSGANSHEFHLPNVLFISRKLQMIENMQRDRPVIRS